MAVTTNRIVSLARKARDLAAETKDLQARMNAFLAYNSSNTVNWPELAKGEKGVDADGVLEGEDFTIAEVSNAIGTFDVLNSLLVNQGHLGNLHKLAAP